MNPCHVIIHGVAGANAPSPVRKKCFFAWMLPALLLTLCAARAEGPAAAPDNSAATVTKQTVSAPKSPVKLLDAGSEPRTVLRLHPVAGDKQTLNMTTKTAMTMAAGGKQMPAMAMPAALITLNIAVTGVSATGDIAYEMVIADANVITNASTPPAVAAAMKSSLASVRGVTCAGSMSANGIINQLEMKTPAGAGPRLRQTLDQMKESFTGTSTPLPEEAVGPGARWEYKTQFKLQGMTVDQTATYELVSITGDRLTLRSSVTQNAANQEIQTPATPGLKTDLVNLTGNGAGASTFDLAHVMPISWTLEENTEVVMSMNMGQQQQTMDTKMNVNVTLEAK